MNIRIRPTVKVTEQEYKHALQIVAKYHREQEFTLDKTVHISNLDITVRLYNAFKSNGIKTMEDVSKITYSDFIKFRNVGTKTLKELNNLLLMYNLPGLIKPYKY